MNTITTILTLIYEHKHEYKSRATPKQIHYCIKELLQKICIYVPFYANFDFLHLLFYTNAIIFELIKKGKYKYKYIWVDKKG